MATKRISFDDAKKILHCSSFPSSVVRLLAQHLDLEISPANWESLAEQLEVSPIDSRWMKSRAKNSHGSPTLLLFDDFIQRDICLGELLGALESIKNFACANIIKEEYAKGTFDVVLKELVPIQIKIDKRSVRVFVTYSEDSRKHLRNVMQLCECLKRNGFVVGVDIGENEHLAMTDDKLGLSVKRYQSADCVLALISPKYFRDVTGSAEQDKSMRRVHSLNTLYIHRCMQAEYMMNSCSNKRFIPVLMPGAVKDDVPDWLRKTNVYAWPDQYNDLFVYMTQPPAQVQVTTSQSELREQDDRRLQSV